MRHPKQSTYIVVLVGVVIIGLCAHFVNITHSPQWKRVHLTGYVVDAQGHLVKGALVNPDLQKTYVDGRHHLVVYHIPTDENGRFDYTDVPGEYQLNVEARHYRNAFAIVKVQSGQTTTTRFVMYRDPHWTARGTVYEVFDEASADAGK